MKRLLFFFGLIVFIYACSSQKNAVQVNKSEVDVTAEDSTEYDVETFDGRFETWYEFYKTPSTYRSQEYYENWNRQYVSAWNANCASSTRRWNFEPVVGYNPSEDYGFDLNHELFHYFMYVENVLRIPIISHGPRFMLR